MNEESAPTANNSLFSAMSGFDLLDILWSRRKLIAVTSCIVVVLTAGLLFLVPNKYASSAIILPTSTGDKFADLKALAGIKGGNSGSESSSELFPTILYSRTVQDALLSHRYSTGTNSITLGEYFNEENPDKLREALTGITGVTAERKTGVITVTVETEIPELSQAIAQTYVDELERYNMYKRRSQGKLNADYLNRQLTEQDSLLAKAEDNLEQFQNENRDWAATTNPEIVKGIARLQREVEARSSAVLFLNQQHEIAKFDAQKDIPIVQVLDAPSVPTVKSSPKRLIWVVFSGLVTIFAMCSLILLATVFKRLEDGETEAKAEAAQVRLPEPISRMARILAQKEVV
jgi:uncharacterized protein involved in exopolysaccharide biosynthesis